MISLLLIALQPNLPVPLSVHGWEEVGSQKAINDDTITLRYWIAPDSIRPLAEQPDTFTVAVTIENILSDGTQDQLRAGGHIIDCTARTWQIDWGAFAFQDRAYVSVFARDQRGKPQKPEPGTGMAAVIERVCDHTLEPKQ